MQRRRAFVLIAATILVLTFALLVVGPGVERGGVQEVLIIGVVFLAILGFERFLRTRP